MGAALDFLGIGARPYPKDFERRRRVLVALAEQDMTISDLALSLNLSQTIVSLIVNGRRLSPKTQQRIAEYLGKPADDLFPPRTAEDIRKMRQDEAAAKGGAP